MNLNLILKHRTEAARASETKSDSIDGFTLIEVMIAIVLLVMISMSIYQATTQTFKYRAKIITEGDFYSGVRLAMGLMDRDVAALFSPVTLNPNQPKTGTEGAPETVADQRTIGRPPNTRNTETDPNAALKAQQLEDLMRSELGQVTDFWLGATDLTAIRPSRFVGTADRLQFISSSHQRVYKDFRESEYAKIIYEIRDDPNPDKFENTKILVKVENPNAFDEVEKKDTGAKIYPLLPGIKSFKFRYYRRERDAQTGTWETVWDTSKNQTQGIYPDLIELTLEVASYNRLSFKGTYFFKPETPFHGLDSTL